MDSSSNYMYTASQSCDSHMTMDNLTHLVVWVYKHYFHYRMSIPSLMQLQKCASNMNHHPKEVGVVNQSHVTHTTVT